MILETVLQKEWNISAELQQRFCKKNLKMILHSFNQMSGGSYFFADYYNKELIVDSSDSLVLCGYPREYALKEGLSFFKRILKKEELHWQKQTAKSIANIFFSLDEEERKNMMLLYNMPVKPKDSDDEVLHYKIIPFHLCENGNLWIALGYVSLAISQKPEHNVCLVNHPKQTRYDLKGDEFEAIKINPLSSEELKLLRLLVQNMLEKGICELLKLNKYRYHRMKESLFKKLEVDTPASAIQRAHHLGLI